MDRRLATSAAAGATVRGSSGAADPAAVANTRHRATSAEMVVDRDAIEGAGGLRTCAPVGWRPMSRLCPVVMVAFLLLAAPAAASAWNEIEGTREADVIRGTALSDRIRGLAGDDVVRGRAGDDRLVGGRGDDRLKGGPGQDTFVCGAGRDVAVIGIARIPERVGDGCEAIIFDVSPGAGSP